MVCLLLFACAWHQKRVASLVATKSVSSLPKPSFICANERWATTGWSTHQLRGLWLGMCKDQKCIWLIHLLLWDVHVSNQTSWSMLRMFCAHLYSKPFTDVHLVGRRPGGSGTGGYENGFQTKVSEMWSDQKSSSVGRSSSNSYETSCRVSKGDINTIDRIGAVD